MSKLLLMGIITLLLGCDLVPAQSSCKLAGEAANVLESQGIVESIIRNLHLKASKESQGDEKFFTFNYKLDQWDYTEVIFMNALESGLGITAMIITAGDTQEEASTLFNGLNNIVKTCKSDHKNGKRHCYGLEDGVIHLLFENEIMILEVASNKDARHNELFYDIVDCLKERKIAHLYWIDGYAFGERE